MCPAPSRKRKTHWMGGATHRALCGVRTLKYYITDTEDKVTCLRCHRSDDKRVAAQYKKDQTALPPEERDGYGC